MNIYTFNQLKCEIKSGKILEISYLRPRPCSVSQPKGLGHEMSF